MMSPCHQKTTNQDVRGIQLTTKWFTSPVWNRCSSHAVKWPDARSDLLKRPNSRPSYQDRRCSQCGGSMRCPFHQKTINHADIDIQLPTKLITSPWSSHTTTRTCEESKRQQSAYKPTQKAAGRLPKGPSMRHTITLDCTSPEYPINNSITQINHIIFAKCHGAKIILTFKSLRQ